MPGERDEGIRTDNRISGGTYQAAVVQVGSVGTLHINSPRPEEHSAEARSARRWLALGVAVAGAVVAFVMPPVGVVVLVVGLVWWLVLRVQERRGPRRRPTAAQLARMAQEMAAVLTEEYAREENQLHVHDPAPIPVRWTAASPLLSDHEANVRRMPVGAEPAASGQPMDLTGDFDAIGPFFETVPSRRLVVLGAPGAGKSALVLHLARALLRDRAPEDPVPALLPIASWNPTEEDLWHWACRRLSAQHPAALRTPQVAHDLITSGRILPILDGFDELPEPTRPKALASLRRSLNDPARLVLTCRIEEYEEAVAEAHTVLPAAAVVELRPLDVDDLKAYLPRTAPRTDPLEETTTKWSPVLARLADEDDQAPEVVALRSVLGTPLMVSLARVAYSETREDPGELLEEERFREPAAVERHLYEAFLTATYENGSGSRWSGEQARRWVGYLAAQLRSKGEQDIAWWRLGDAVPWPVRWLGTGLAVVVAAVAVGLTSFDYPRWRDWVPVPPWLAVLVLGSVAALLDWAVAPPAYPPQRLSWPGREEWRGLGVRARAMWAPALAGLGIVAGVDYLVDDVSLLWGIPVAWTAGVLAVAAFTYMLGMLSRPADPADAREPAALLRTDHLTQLVLGLFAILRPTNRRWATEAVLLSVFLLVCLWQVTVEHRAMSGPAWLRTFALVLLAWLLCRWSVSAAGRLAVARFYFALTGVLPWRVMDFLGDAHRRGVLRQSGGLYRFRHIELRNRLAEAHGVTADGDSGQDPAQREAAPEGFGGQVVANQMLFGLAAAGLLLYADPHLTYPYQELASPCALISPAQVREAIVDPVRDTDSASSGCVYYERSRSRPARRIVVSSTAMSASWGVTGPEEAAWEMRWDSRLPLPGLGDEWFASVDPDGPRNALQSTFNIRVGNLIITVSYAEAGAPRDRVTAVARTLAEEALRRFGVPPEKIGSAGRTPADVPSVKPSTINYREPERGLHGAVWGKGESTDYLTLNRMSIVVRTPKDLYCDRTRAVQEDREYASGCGVRDAEGVELDIADRTCHKDGCSPLEIRNFMQGRPGGPTASWRIDQETGVEYAVSRPGAGRYEMSLFALHTADDGRPHLVWLRVNGDEKKHATQVQKIVNSAYTQVTAP
ncbi:NACHT domain-containing protein [Streptomyces sp. NPDC050803]|uniref:NACHT domain-containing protein n=1 Tax=unclassified Streptomyces TaxID=2593676 RepID=UPI0034451386